MLISLKSTMVAVAVAAVAITNFHDFAGAAKNAVLRHHVIEIRGSAFVPAEISVRAGDTIEWINRDIVPHTVSAKDDSWDSDHLDPGDAWRMVVTHDAVTDYFCRFHPTMTALIRIKN